MIKKKFRAVAVLLAFSMMFASGCTKPAEATTEGSSDPGITWSEFLEAMNGGTTEADTSVTEDTTGEATTEAVVTPQVAHEVDPAVTEEFKKFCDEYFEESVTCDTLSFHYTIKDGSNYGIEAPETATLGDATITEEVIEEEEKEYRAAYERLLAIDYNKLSEEDQFDYDILKETYETGIMSYVNSYMYEPLSPMGGIQESLSTYFTDYEFYQKSDVEDYITLINDIPRYFDGLLDYERLKSEKGYFMENAVCDRVIEQCETFLEDRDNHFMVTVFNERIDELDFLTDEEKAEFKKQNEDAVKNSLFVAYDNIISTFKELRGTGKYEGGCYAYPNGKEYYTYRLKYYTGTAKTPEEVIEMLDTQMESLLTELYSVYFSNPSAYQYFADNYDSLFGSSDDMSIDDILDTLMKDATANYPDIGTLNYKTNFLAKSLESIMDNTLAYYMSPALDDPDNNIIYVNGSHMDGLWSTIAHEGYPGHMYQYSYYRKTNPKNVRLILSYLGYIEGWAMYASYDAISAYDFDGSRYAKELASLYRINEELGYIIMGRIDLGINYEGWTISDCKDYLTKQGYSSSAAEEIYETVVGDPALYQSYVTGYYEMKELAQYAEDKLGDKFDVKEFNTVILDAGPCQYDLLKRKVDEYIASK